MPFSSFPLPPEQPSETDVAARLADQTAMANQIVGSFGSVVGERLNTQATDANKIAGKLVRAVKPRIKSQKAMVDTVTTNLYVGAGQRLASQGQVANSLRGFLIPECGSNEASLGPQIGPGWWLVLEPGGSPTCYQIGDGSLMALCTGAIVLGGPYDDRHKVPPDWPCYVPCDQSTIDYNGRPIDPTCAGDGIGICPPGMKRIPTVSGIDTCGVVTPPEEWICAIQNSDVATLVTMTRDAFNHLVIVDPTWSIFASGYATEEEAKAACSTPDGGAGGAGGGDGEPLVCPDPPCPVDCAAPPPDLPAVISDCAGLPGALAGGIPEPGSKAWCQAQEQILAFLADVGNALIDEVLGAFLPGDITGRAVAPAWTWALGIGSPAGTVSKAILDVLQAMGVDVRTHIKGLVTCWREIISKTTTCNPGAMLALSVLRGVLSMLDGAVFGLEFVARFTMRFKIDLPAIRRAVEYILESICPSVIPDCGTSIQTWLQGQIDTDTLRCWCASHGVSIDVWDPVITARAERVAAPDVILHGRLTGKKPDEIDLDLVHRAWAREEDRQWMKYLYDKPGTPSQWFAWARADVLDEDTVALFRLDAGFAEFWREQPGKEIFAQGMIYDIARREWCMQQRLPAEGVAQRWLWELQPGRRGVDHPFTDELYLAVLHTENWADPVEQWMIDTRYRFPSLIEAREMRRRRLISEDDWQSSIAASGMRTEYAGAQRQIEEQDYRRWLQTSVGAFTLPHILSMVQWKTLDGPTANIELLSQGYTVDQITIAAKGNAAMYLTQQAIRGAQFSRRTLQRAVTAGYTMGTLAADTASEALRQLGWQEDAILTFLSALDLSARQSLAGSAIRSLKKAYMGGELSDAQALNLLLAAQITDVRAVQLAAEWAFERSATRKMASAGQILKWVQDGLLPPAVARLRLINLGYRDPDLTLMMAENAQRIAKALASAEAKVEKEKEKEAARLARLAKEAEAAREKLRRAAMSQEPVSFLHHGYVEGVLTSGYVSERLALYGFDEQTIRDYLTVWAAEGSGKPQTTNAPAATG